MNVLYVSIFNGKETQKGHGLGEVSKKGTHFLIDREISRNILAKTK